MGLFDNIRQKKELEQLRKAVRETPSPKTYTALINRCIELGEEGEALLIASGAIKEFPDSDIVFERYYRLRKSQAHNEIENLKKVLEERPTPAAYAQLAEIYRDLRDEESALKYCREAIQKFPNDDSPYTIIGELRLRRFYKDPLVKDGQMAIENFEKAYEINNRNYKALLSLAKLYLQLGALSKAKQRMRNILVFAPEDDTVQKMLDTSSKVPKPPHEDLDILLQTAETQGELYYNFEEEKIHKSLLPPSPEEIEKPLEKFKNLSGLLCVMVCDLEGNLITQYAQDGIDLNTYYEIASTIYQTVQQSSRQMDIGRCLKCQIEGPFGIIQIIASEGLVYMAFVTQDQKQIALHLQKFIGNVNQIKQGE